VAVDLSHQPAAGGGVPCADPDRDTSDAPRAGGRSPGGHTRRSAVRRRPGWASPGVMVPLVAGIALLAMFVAYEARASHPMLPLGLFRRRNFSAGNVETFAMYAGLAILFFFLTIFLQQIG